MTLPIHCPLCPKWSNLFYPEPRTTVAFASHVFSVHGKTRAPVTVNQLADWSCPCCDKIIPGIWNKVEHVETHRDEILAALHAKAIGVEIEP